MMEEGWRPLRAEAGRFLGHSQSTVEVGGAAVLPSRLPVGDTAVACVVEALTAAALLQQQRCGSEPDARIEAAQVAAAVRSETYLQVNGQPVGSGFAPLSRFWRAADGWVRTHANYPWHHDALLRALGTGPDVDAVEAAIAERGAGTVEADVVAAGGLAAAVRTVGQWCEHPQGRAVAEQPLIGAARIEGATPRRRNPAELPAVGLRVLDLTRVIAGPVATRYLAALGADVLRVDPPHRPELTLHRYDGLPGKRSAVLDARTPGGLQRLHELLDGADVLVHGYRPGALAMFGLDTDPLATRHPGLVVVSLSTWGSTGPWGDRRGFDSIVQAACGIAVIESPDGDRPGTLPCQLLDHGTGYLAAAAALEGVRRQSRVGGSHTFELSLAATALWLLTQPQATPLTAEEAAAQSPSDEWLTTLQSDLGPVHTITPPGTLNHRPLRWPEHMTTYGNDPPSW